MLLMLGCISGLCWNSVHLIEKYTWSNNQDNLVMAKIDRIFVSTEWDSGFPLASVKCLDRFPSDHNPLVLDTSSNVFFGKKRFRFEKWWLYQDGFFDTVKKAWNTPCLLSNSLDRWQFKIRTLCRFVRDWALNEVARLNKYKK